MPSFLSSLLGSKPTVPNLPQLNLGTEQQTAIASNAAALPGAENLVNQTNLFSQDQITKMLNATIPGFDQMTKTASSNIESLLQGQIPKDVQDAISRSDAASALTGGFGGTEASRNLTARDLGLTSLQLTGSGLSSAESWTKTMASIYEPSQLNVSSMFISPMQQYQTDNEQNLQQFQRQWMQNQISAMPAMWAQDLKEAVETAASMYGGSGPTQSAGTLPAGVSSGLGDPGMGASGEGGAGFSPGGAAYSTNFVDTGNVDFGGGGMGGGGVGLDAGAGFGGGMGGII